MSKVKTIRVSEISSVKVYKEQALSEGKMLGNAYKVINEKNRCHEV